jgi:flagellar M-ring protein FliF
VKPAKSLRFEAGKPRPKPKERTLTAAELARIETLVQQAIGFDAQRGDAVSVVNAPFARAGADAADEGPPLWEQPRARDLLRVALGGLAVLVLILTVLRPAFRQLIAPKRQVVRATLVEPDEEIPVALSAPATARAGASPATPMNLDEKLEVARTAVNTDAKRVAQVVRDWVESDA